MSAPGGAAPVGPPGLARVLYETAGITPASVLGRDLDGALREAARRLATTVEALGARLEAREPESVRELLEAVLVHESHFFRHPEQLDALGREVLARLPRDRSLSLWSAGCAAGEEPYTLAIALAEAGRLPGQDRILATDVSARVLETARAGEYAAWSLRGLSAARRARFFEAGRGGALRVLDPLRAPVEFRVHEVVRGGAPGPRFDVVLCRNLLVYLAPDAIARATRTLVDALAPGGVLVVAPAELGLLRGHVAAGELSAEGAWLRRPAERAPRPARPARAAIPRDPQRAPAPAPAPAPEPEPAPAPATAEPPRRSADAPQDPEAWLLAGASAEASGDVAAAAEAVRRALYLDPRHAQAHALLAGLYRRLGRPEDARRARRNAMALLEGLDDGETLPGLGELTVGALRGALEAGE